jgi:pimeloyl-ACP methyl ester carboxylesterase
VVRTEYLPVAGGRVAYEVAGEVDGPLVVCVHGLGESRRTFRFLVPLLADAGYRVAAMDVRGYGESAGEWQDYSVESVGADMLALTWQLGGPAVVVGHSIGGASAAWAAAEAPEAISGLVLIGTSAFETPVKAWMKPLAAAVCGSAALWGMYCKSLFITVKPADLRQYVTGMKASLRRRGGIAPLRAQNKELASGVRPRYPEVRCPALILMGARDKDLPDPAAEASLVARRLAGPATVTVVPDSGHYVQIEMPDQAAAAIIPFAADQLGFLASDVPLTDGWQE